MSISCLSTLFRRGDSLKSSDYQVLVALCFYLRRDDIKKTGQASCWPSTPMIAKKSHISENLVRKSLKSLESLGLISISNRFSKNRVFTIRLADIIALGEDTSKMQCSTACAGYPDKCEECFVRDEYDAYQFGSMELGDCLIQEQEKLKTPKEWNINSCENERVQCINPYENERVQCINPYENERVQCINPYDFERATLTISKDKQDIEQEINKERKKEKKEIVEKAEEAKKVIPIKPTPKRKNKTRCPFELNSPIPDEYRQCAEEISTVFTPQLQFEKFVAYHTSKGNTFVNWKAAFRNWMLKAVDFMQEQSRPPQGKNNEKRSKAFGQATRMGPSRFEPRYSQIDYTLGATKTKVDFSDDELEGIDF